MEIDKTIKYNTLKISLLFLICFFIHQTILHGQQWSEPEIVAENRNVSDFTMALDARGRIHLILSEDKTGDVWPDSLYFWIRENNLWQHLETLGKDNLKMPAADGLAIDVDKDDNAHFLWGMQRATVALGFFHIIYPIFRKHICN